MIYAIVFIIVIFFILVSKLFLFISKFKKQMSQQLSDLQAAVANTVSLQAEAVTLVNNLKALDDTAALQTLTDQLTASNQSLAAVVNPAP